MSSLMGIDTYYTERMIHYSAKERKSNEKNRNEMGRQRRCIASNRSGAAKTHLQIYRQTHVDEKQPQRRLEPIPGSLYMIYSEGKK